MSTVLRLGTRGSKLALWQANWVAGRLRERGPGVEVHIEVIKTSGDLIQDRPLDAIGVRGAFTKELDRALLSDEVDLLVHSLKDVPTQLPEGIVLAAIPERADARDVFIGKRAKQVNGLPKGATVGTGSLRRRAQLLAACPGVETVALRGNIDTRIRKLHESEVLDGLILAAAGVLRTGLTEHVTQYLAFTDWLPAPGQGALAVAAREGSAAAQTAAAALEDTPTRTAVTAERALLHRVEGGCHVPVGAYAEPGGDTFTLHGVIASPDGDKSIRSSTRFAPDEAAQTGEALAETLLSEGGDAILRALAAT